MNDTEYDVTQYFAIAKHCVTIINPLLEGKQVYKTEKQ